MSPQGPSQAINPLLFEGISPPLCTLNMTKVLARLPQAYTGEEGTSRVLG